MSQLELNDGLAQHMLKPGAPSLNPNGIQETKQHRMKRLEIKAALSHELDEPCTLPGHEGETWFRAGILTLLRLYVEGVPWATKEIFNRTFGRTPVNFEAAITVSAPPLAELTTAELLARAEEVAAAAKRLNEQAIDAEWAVLPEPAEPVHGDDVPFPTRTVISDDEVQGK